MGPRGTLDLTQGAGDVRKRRAGAGEQGAAGVGQVDRPGGARVEARADPVLERLELMADRGRPDPQRLRRGPQGAVLGNRQKHLEARIGQSGHW